MTSGESTAASWLRGRDSVRWGILQTLVVFGFAGAVVFTRVFAYRRLKVPLADTADRHFLEGLSVVPPWVDPVALTPEAVLGLELPTMIASVELWVVAVCTVAVASGLGWWWLDAETAGFAPPLERFFQLSLFAVAAALPGPAFAFLLAGQQPELSLVTPAIAIVYGLLLPVPVTIVLDGRGVINALVWCGEQASPFWRLMGFVAVLAFASLRNIAGDVSLAADPLLDLALVMVLGTAVVGSLFAVVSLRVYRGVDDPEPI